jgi:PleD family two-component response regulator
MSISLVQKSVLIVEPNLHQQKPYAFLNPKIFKISRISNSLMAAEQLQKQKFDLIFLSCSFSSKKLLNFLESFKQASTTKIIPLILVVDFNQPFSIVPGLTWNNQLGLLSSISSKKELDALLTKLL